MNIKSKSVYFIGSLLVFLVSATAVYRVLSSEPSRYEGKIVRKIEFEGLKNVDAEDVKEIMQTTEGYPLKAVEVREDIKNIFALGQFENVSVEIDDFSDGVKLKMVMEERPVIEKVEYKGNDDIVETDLIEALQLKEGSIYRKDLLENGIKAVKAKYDKEGHSNAYITYKVKKGENDNSVIIDIIIDEGEDIKVKKLAILGAAKIYVKEVQGVMETKEDTLFQDGAFKKEVFEEDKRKILAYYKQEGFLDAQILEERVSYEWTDPTDPGTRCVYIVLKLSEGERYYFDGAYDIKFAGGKSTVFSDDEINKLKDGFALKDQGEIFDNTKFQNDMQSISMKYGSQGYIFARVVPNKTITEREVDADGVKEKRKFVKVDFSVEEGKKAYIEQIIIKGNKKTKDKVIRRELLVKEGEIFDSEKLNISRETVYNLGYFKQVNYDLRPGTKDGFMNLIVDVEEQPSGTISMGGGYGSTSGFSIFADVTENNFLGTGRTVGTKFEYGPKKTAVTLSYQDRWFMDYPVGFNASIFYQVYQYTKSSIFPLSSNTSDYKLKRFGYSLGLSYRFWYYWVTGASWIQSWKLYFDPSGNSPDDTLLLVVEGQQSKRTMQFYVYRDSKDNYLNPTKGFRTGITASYTGGQFLRGDDHYSQYSPEFYAYFSPFHLPFLKTHPTVFEFRASADFLTPPLGKNWTRRHKSYAANEWLEYADRLDIGGPETVRGWERYGDSAMPESWQNVGLYDRILYGAEYRIPLHPQMLWVAAFFDAGSLWTDKYWYDQITDDNREYVDKDMAPDANGKKRLRNITDITGMSRNQLLEYFIYSYGFGIKVQVPMMPLRFWFGKKMIYDDGFKTISGYNFQFAIGDIRF